MSGQVEEGAWNLLAANQWDFFFNILDEKRRSNKVMVDMEEIVKK